MRPYASAIFLCLFLTSCFLSKPYRIENFNYADKGSNYSFPLVVPRGYSKKWTSVDETGNSILTYSYRNGSIFYMAHMTDTAADMQPIDMQENIARQSHHTGALIYKGMDKNDLYWREVRQKNFRVGYRYVSSDNEYKFDSATNYLVVWPLKNASGL